MRRWSRDPVGTRLRPAAMALQGVRGAVHAHGAARQACAVKDEAISLDCTGSSLNATGKRLGVSMQSVMRSVEPHPGSTWVRDHARKLPGARADRGHGRTQEWSDRGSG